MSSGELIPGAARVSGTNDVNTALFDALDGELTAVYWKGTTQARPTLLHGGSTSSFVLGGALAIESSPAPEATAPFTSRWLAVDSITTFEISLNEPDNSFATNSAFGTTFGANPNVQVSLDIPGSGFGTGDSIIYGIDNVTTSACSSYISYIGDFGGVVASVATMHLRSEGTVTL